MKKGYKKYTPCQDASEMIYFIWRRAYLFWSNPVREIYLKAVPVGAGTVLFICSKSPEILTSIVL